MKVRGVMFFIKIKIATSADLDSLKKDSSMSIYGGTRKMVNYA